MKICIICAANNNNFIKDIGIALKKKNYNINGYDNEFSAHISGSDIIWLEWFDGSTVQVLMSPKSSTKKYIVRLHRYELFTKRTIAQLDEITKLGYYKKIDKLVFVSEYIRQIGIEKYPWMKDISVVIPNLIDMDKFPFIEREEGNKLLFLGKLAYVKNIPLLLACMSELHKKYPGYELHIVGSIWEEEIGQYLCNFIKKTGLKNVYFRGYVDNKDLPGFTAKMSWIACTSIIESQGLGIMECMAMGMMPVIYNFGGAEDIFPEKFLFIHPCEFSEIIRYGYVRYSSHEYRYFVLNNYSIQKKLHLYEDLLKEV